MKRIIFHLRVHPDIDAIMNYYEGVADRALADDFYVELRRFIVEAAKNPEAYAVRKRNVRRVNLDRFPYHFLFRVIDDVIRILVIRHHRRHPSLGTHRR